MNFFKMIGYLPVVFALFAFGCTFDGGDSRNAEASVNQVNDSISRPLTVQVRTDPIVETRSLDYGLTVLRKDGEDKYELRIWSTVDLTYYERCFILERVGENWRAMSIVPVLDHGELIRDKKGKAKITIEHINLTPTLDLDELISRLGLETLSDYGPDENRAPAILDEGIITIEVKNKSNYDVISYRAFTQTVEGKNMIAKCKTLEITIGVQIGCEHS